MNHLSFLTTYSSGDRTEYLETLLKMLDAEHRFQEDGNQFGWRFSQHQGTDAAENWFTAKAGHVQKLVNEGIVEKTYQSNNYTHYRLDVQPGELADDLRDNSEFLSPDQREKLDKLPY